MGTNPRIYFVLYTYASIQLQFHPYIHNVEWLEICGGVDNHISFTYIHMILTATSLNSPENISWVLTQIIGHQPPSHQHPHHTTFTHIRHHTNTHIYCDRASIYMKFYISMFHHCRHLRWNQGLSIFASPCLNDSK